MPINEYVCEQCGTTMEIIQKFDAQAPVCGCGHAMKKLISRSNFHLKGSGWYATDYSNKPAAPKESDEKPKPKYPVEKPD